MTMDIKEIFKQRVDGRPSIAEAKKSKSSEKVVSRGETDDERIVNHGLEQLRLEEPKLWKKIVGLD